MIHFITWPKTIDAAFRADYLIETGEKIQDNPTESLDDLSYLVGSSRVVQTHLDNLKITHSAMVFNQDSPPTGWIPKV